MQIHEVTKKQKLDEGILDAAKAAAMKIPGASTAAKVANKVSSGIQGAKQGFQQAGIDRNVNATADRAYDVWSKYKAQLAKSAADQGRKLEPAEVERALLAFVNKNLLGGQHLPNLINKDDIIGIVKKIAGSSGTTTPPADTGAGADAGATASTDATTKTGTTAATTTAKPKIEAGQEVAFSGKNYRWLGAQWAEVNPSTGKAGKTAEKAIAPELNKMAAAGKFVKPQTGAGAGAFGQMATTLGGKPAAPETPANTMANAPVSVRNTAKTTPADATTTAPATTKPNYGGTPGAAYKPVTNVSYNQPNGLPNVSALRPTTPAATTPAKPTLGSTAPGQTFNLGGQKIKPGDPLYDKLAASTVKEAAGNPQEKELFRQLLRATSVATPAASTGQKAPGAPAADADQTQSTNAAGMVDQVKNTEQQQAQISPPQLKKAGDVLKQTFQIDSSVGSTDDEAVDALLMAMGFNPA